MDRGFFHNAGLQFEPSSQPAWKLMTLMPEMNFPPEQSSVDGFRHPNWEKSDQYSNFESALSSMVSSPVSNSTVSNDTAAVRELIGKLGSIPNAGGDVSQVALAAAAPYSSTNTSCYSTPLNSSPPKLNMPIMDHFVNENLPRMRNSMPLNPSLPSLAADPGFAERAAKFSCFSRRSFNGRTSELGLNTNNSEFQFRSNASPLIGNTKLPRVSSSPSLKIDGSPVGFQHIKNSDETNAKKGSCSDKKFSRLSGSATNSNEESSVSEQIPSGEIGFRNQKDSNSRKRKVGSSMGFASATAKEGEANDDSNTKRSKKPEQENGGGKTEENTKPPEPPKDYIHVRARRGQATDSHSLAERVRREKISERMKLLQDLVPNCNKVTGKALMLDEIINYVQSLQRQVEFLSMKLATMNPRLDFDTNTLLLKDTNQSNGNVPQQIYAIESSASAFYQQNQQVLFNSSVEGFTEPFPQFPGFGQDDLQNIVQMGFGESLDLDATFLNAAPDQTTDMKMEL